PLKGELRLQEEIAPLDDSIANRRRDPAADGGLEVVSPLVGRVDAAEAGGDRRLHEALGVVFLPGGAVDESRHTDAVDGQLSLGHDAILLRQRPLRFFLRLFSEISRSAPPGFGYDRPWSIVKK